MPDDNLDFGSLFDDEPGSSKEHEETTVPDNELFTFEDDFVSHGDDPVPVSETPHPRKPIEPIEKKRRSSLDFEPDMDALLLTAQSSMIIEGTKYMGQKLYSHKALPIYTEAIKGIDLYIKILERNPNNYHKLSKMIVQDIDCREVERLAFSIYKAKYNEAPQTDDHKLRAYELFRDRLKIAYFKSLISQTMAGIKKYFLLSGGTDTEKINSLIQNEDITLKSDVARISQHTNLALEMLKHGNAEISGGMKGREMNMFIIRSSELLQYYYTQTGRTQTADYYKRLHTTYSKYFVIRD
ncbi:MAG: hypothetical protein CVV44_03085 [Spirochaetae bacterium HGW-Spirochaetae-1]|jgi:hypothetical protein|nr:MAG: hypothetical protein CVV44_03085 [Spirochaetae bacterium HGW-Spirochaetae-1]